MTFLFINLQGQFIALPIGHIHKEKASNVNARKMAFGDPLTLPFWDDFSFSKNIPDTTLWSIGENVFINPATGIQPTSLHVATFDGTNAAGLPYNTNATTPELTDVLESNEINLSSLTTDDDVVLSFYWQMQGNGNQPNRKDSLSLIFYDESLIPVTVWSKAGDTLNLDSSFQEVRIKLEEEYLHGNFQFRFQSLGNPGGAFDHWHIDYVYLNRDRPEIGNESLNDHAVASEVSSIFTPYTSIPRSQLFAFGDTIFSNMTFALSNFENAVENVNFSYRFFKIDSINGTIQKTLLDDLTISNQPGMNPFKKHQLYLVPARNISIFPNDISASTFESEIIYNSQDGYFKLTDDGSGNVTYLIDETYNYRLNDTSRFHFEIDEILAYDDGTAENSAGVKSESGGARIAIYFNIATSDTLTHIDINFPNIKELPENPRFKLSIAKNLSDDEESIITSQEYESTITISSFDQFATFEFDKPVILEGGFYVIFEQFTGNRFPIGLDLNTQNGDKIYLNYGNAWEPNNVLDVNGSLMIRPRFADSDYIVTDVDSRNLGTEIGIYPNPARDYIIIDGQFDQFDLYNLSGHKVLTDTSNKISIQSLPDGIYLMKVYYQEAVISKKIIIRR